MDIDEGTGCSTFLDKELCDESNEDEIKEKRIQYYITRAEKELPLFDDLPASLMDI